MLRIHVRDVRIRKGMKVSELIDSMRSMGGFSAQNMISGIDILERMLADRDSFNFLSFPADIVATGMRGMIADSVKNFDAIITTCGTLDHDLAKAHGGKYSHGSFDVDDRKLHRLNIYRLGNIFIERDEYGLELEEAFNEIMEDICRSYPDRKEYSPSELLAEFGKRVKDEHSILRQAYLNKVPVFVPGIVDGAFGTQMMLFFRRKGLEKEIERLAEKLADRAMVYAVHAGRKRTIRREDVLLTGRIAAPAMPHQADQRWPVNLRKNARSTNAASSRER